MKNRPRVLLVEDSASLAAIYKQYLIKEDIELIHVTGGEEAKKVINDKIPRLVFLDLKLTDIPGEDVLRWIRDQELPISVVVITAHGSIDIAVDLMRLGAQDFLQKPFDATRLITTMHNALENSHLKDVVSEYTSTFERDRYHGFIGASLPMQTVYRIIDSAAPSKATVFITGGSGTGKEVCAEAIHKQSRCKDGPFIPLNCGAIPKDLMESEIFGHVKGAFTGASSERKGAASLAHGGTLFLDEIGEMDLDLQTKLLRFIQSGTIKKVGGSKEESVDVRFICATNRDPLEEVNNGRFREDLYYRLNVVPLKLPPLRQRNEDILLLASYFLDLYSKEDDKAFKYFSAEVETVLRNYPWPGNIRQLQNVIRNIVVLHNSTTVELKHLPPPLDGILNTPEMIQAATPTSISPPPPATPHVEALDQSSQRIRTLADIEREAIQAAINTCSGNIPKAAAELGVSPSTIYRKIQGWSDSVAK